MIVLIRPPSPMSPATLQSVDDVEPQFLRQDLLLHLARQMIPDLPGTVDSVQQEHRTGTGILQHVELLQELELMTGDEVSIMDQVLRADGARTETQMGDGHWHPISSSRRRSSPEPEMSFPRR